MVLLISLLIMVAFDQITWEKQFGLQFLLTTLMILIGLLILILIEKKKVPWQSILLLIPILFSAVMTIFRRETSTTFFNILLTLLSLLLLALTLLNGQWLIVRFREIFIGILYLIQSLIISPVSQVIKKFKAQAQLTPKEKNANWEKAKPFLRGVLIAIPILLILGALLASADMIFKDRLSNLFNWINFENFSEFIWRTVYILFLSYILAGAYIHALTHSADKKAINDDKPVVKPFLGKVESFIVLGLINLLFLSFIIIQFRYFFAGEANISFEGFTYAEYARRGFFELVAVAIISLGIFYLLSMITKRTDQKERRFFSLLGILLMAQVGCMLISAFQRLTLYEAAYGFTTLRTITHVFIIWLGVLLIAAVLMEIFNQFRRMALVLFLVLFGFTLTLNLLNVDRFIAKRNVEHAIAGNPLDAYYLVRNMSSDGLPDLFDYLQSESTPEDVKSALEASLACRYASDMNDEEKTNWVEWHFSDSRLAKHYTESHSVLESYPFIQRNEKIYYEEDGKELEATIEAYFIEVNDVEVFCYESDW
jgi:hypothetical protein